MDIKNKEMLISNHSRKIKLKVFGYILSQLKPQEDMFLFFLGDCMKYTGYKTAKPIYEGLSYLIASEIIARGRADTIYYINPLIVFNGNRVTFAKSYVKKIANKEGRISECF